jgi:hypothetical protein
MRSYHWFLQLYFLWVMLLVALVMVDSAASQRATTKAQNSMFGEVEAVVVVQTQKIQSTVADILSKAKSALNLKSPQSTSKQTKAADKLPGGCRYDWLGSSVLMKLMFYSK